MKRFAFALSVGLCAFTLSASSQDIPSLSAAGSHQITKPATETDTLRGVWGLRFGMSKDSVIRAVKAKTGKSPEPTSAFGTSGSIINYHDISFGGDKAGLMRLLVNKAGLYEVDLFFFPDNQQDILYDYKRIKRTLTDKYFQPSADAESYRSPYEKGDGHEITAIKLGYTNIGAIWYFPEGNGNNDANSGIIMLRVEKEMDIQLSYTDAIIYPKVVEELNEKAKSDY